MAALVVGDAYPQRCREVPVSNVPPTGANVCVYPTADQLSALVTSLSGLAVASIGCGEGFLEGLLQREGLTVTAVDLGQTPLAAAGGIAGARWQRSNCFCGEIRRVRGEELYAVPAPATTALLFCFGRRCPLRYDKIWPGRIHRVPLYASAGSSSQAAVL
jgi:hypothetical protein